MPIFLQLSLLLQGKKIQSVNWQNSVNLLTVFFYLVIINLIVGRSALWQGHVISNCSIIYTTFWTKTWTFNLLDEIGTITNCFEGSATLSVITLSIMTFSIMTFVINGSYVTLWLSDTQLKQHSAYHHSAIMLSVLSCWMSLCWV